jgi:hypothetical protein
MKAFMVLPVALSLAIGPQPEPEPEVTVDDLLASYGWGGAWSDFLPVSQAFSIQGMSASYVTRISGLSGTLVFFSSDASITVDVSTYADGTSPDSINFIDAVQGGGSGVLGDQDSLSFNRVMVAARDSLWSKHRSHGVFHNQFAQWDSINGTWKGVTGGGTDGNAVHTNVSGEISGLTEKATPVDGDWLIIEDSAASNVKKKVQVGNVGGSGGAVKFDEAMFMYSSRVTNAEAGWQTQTNGDDLVGAWMWANDPIGGEAVVGNGSMALRTDASDSLISDFFAEFNMPPGVTIADAVAPFDTVTISLLASARVVTTPAEFGVLIYGCTLDRTWDHDSYSANYTASTEPADTSWTDGHEARRDLAVSTTIGVYEWVSTDFVIDDDFNTAHETIRFYLYSKGGTGADDGFFIKAWHFKFH